MMMHKHLLASMIKLIEDFCNNKIDGKHYEKEYMVKWEELRDSNIQYRGEAHDCLDELYSDYDVFCSDPVLFNPKTDINEDTGDIVEVKSGKSERSLSNKAEKQYPKYK